MRDSISRQSTLGVEVETVARGHVELSLLRRDDLCQQHGFTHAGAVTTIADSACGYAAMSLVPADRDILTVGFTTNLLAPATAPKLVAIADVVRSGRTLTIATAQVLGLNDDGTRSIVAVMQATLMAVTTLS